MALIRTNGSFGDPGLEDEALVLVRDQFRRFAEARIAPLAHRWHVEDRLIPLEIVAEMAALGVFGLTVPEDYGGLGLGKLAMCVVTEELSPRLHRRRARSARARRSRRELIRLGGTRAQKERVAAAHRLWRGAADRGVHRAEHRLGPRQPAHPRAREDDGS